LSETAKIAREGPETADLLREALLRGQRRAVLTVSSSSMEPTLRAGDRVTICRTEPALLRQGDIVVFESPLTGLVVHRLMWKVPLYGEPRAFYTKGDALLYLDRPVTARGCLGRVVEIERGGRKRRVRRPTTYIGWLTAAAGWTARRVLAGMRRSALILRKNG
jgi:signal peptidase I